MFYIHTSRPYSNAKPHLGTMMDQLFADTLKRFHLQFEETLFTAGLDEHGLKIQTTAQEQGIQPKEFVDTKYKEFASIYEQLFITPDVLGQTSSKKHIWLANLAWNKLAKKDLIYKKSYEGLYCKGCEDFYAESQLVNGKCPIHQHLELEKISETNYFFKLSSFKDQLKSFLDDVYIPDDSIKIEMDNIREDLQDISISRLKERLSWGVPVSSDPEHVMYVWFEALLSYISSIIPDELFDEWLKSDNKEYVEETIWEYIAGIYPADTLVIGRDNSKFHLLIWPAMLMGLELPAPKSALIHGMITDSQGRKFSKSLGNGVELDEMIEKVGVTGVRHFILHDCNTVGDSPFSWESVTNSYNSNLANNFGNLVVRVTNLIQKNCDGIIETESLQPRIDSNEVYSLLQKLHITQAYRKLFEYARNVNEYLEQTQPWKLAKEEGMEEKVKEVLAQCYVDVFEINRLLSLFQPELSHSVLQALEEFPIVKAPIIISRIEDKE